MSQPGPMGWGLPDEPETKWISAEQEALDTLAAAVPERLMRSAPKTPNADLIAKVQKIQNDNGIESGFCFLYLAEAIFGAPLDWLRQLIGSCVASGDMRTTSYRMLAEVFLLNDPESLPGIDIDGTDSLAFFAPYNYRAGRREAGINGRSDGSLCLPHIRGKMKYGHLPCSTSGLRSDAFPEPQDTGLYKDWGADNRLLDQYADRGKKFQLLESEPIKSAQDFHDVCCDGYKPANICSMWSFEPDYQHPSWKDSQGNPVWIFKRGRQPWAHNMSVIGCVMVGGKEFIIIENSWGNFHKGRKWFAIPASLFDTWVRDAQCQSVGEIDLADNGPAWPEAFA